MRVCRFFPPRNVDKSSVLYSYIARISFAREDRQARLTCPLWVCEKTIHVLGFPRPLSKSRCTSDTGGSLIPKTRSTSADKEGTRRAPAWVERQQVI